MSQDLPPALVEVIDKRVFEFAQAARKHYKTNDLVVLLDLMDEGADLQAVPRQGIVDSEDIPALLRLKISSPATSPDAELGAADLPIWFLVIYEDGGADCAAIHQDMLQEGGRQA